MTRSVFALILGLAVVKVLHRFCNRVPSRFDGTLAPLTCSSHANHPTGHPSAVPAWIWILPQSTKAQAMAAAVQRHRPSVQWWCPQLPPSPAAVMRLLLNDLTDWPLAAKGSQRQPKAIVGSSLGGFHAAVLARRLRCLAVLVNPAVHPARDLARHLGMPTSWLDAAQTFFLRPASSMSFRPWAAGGSQHQRTPSPSSRRATRCWTGAK